MGRADGPAARDEWTAVHAALLRDDEVMDTDLPGLHAGLAGAGRWACG